MQEIIERYIAVWNETDPGSATGSSTRCGRRTAVTPTRSPTPTGTTRSTDLSALCGTASRLDAPACPGRPTRTMTRLASAGIPDPRTAANWL